MNKNRLIKKVANKNQVPEQNDQFTQRQTKSAVPSTALRRVSINDKAPTVSFVQTSFNMWDTANQSSLTFKNRSDDINEILNNTRDFEMFKKFLDQQNALNDLFCWMDIEVILA